MTPHQILTATASHFKMAKAALTGRCRTARVVSARHIAMWLCREMLPMSYPEIAYEFDCDHTTVLSAVKRVNKTPALLSQASVIRQHLEQGAPVKLTECGKCKSRERRLETIARKLAAMIEGFRGEGEAS